MRLVGLQLEVLYISFKDSYKIILIFEWQLFANKKHKFKLSIVKQLPKIFY